MTPARGLVIALRSTSDILRQASISFELFGLFSICSFLLLGVSLFACRS